MSGRPIFAFIGFSLLALSVVPSAGCNESHACSADRECGAGQRCTPQGLCEPVPSPDGSVSSDAGPGDGGPVPDGGGNDAGGDAGPGDGGWDGGADAGTACVPNLDGVLERAEVVLGPGLSAAILQTYDGSGSIAVDLVGQGSSPNRKWDFSAGSSSERVVWETISPAGTWWEASFPDATYAARYTRDPQYSDQLAVVKVTSSEVQLLGVVSSSPNVTLLTYSPPLTTMKLPLAVGDQWDVTTRLSGTSMGVGVAFDDSYHYSVDARGRVKTPLAEFPVIRLQAEQKRTFGMGTYATRRSFYFPAECFGIVAHVVSRWGESAEEFTQAEELWRLSP